MTKNREKNRELFLAQNCLNRIISQLLYNTKKKDKIKKKIKKLIFGSELSEDFKFLTPKKWRKNSKNYFWPRKMK